jgi:hypothetical protein
LKIFSAPRSGGETTGKGVVFLRAVAATLAEVISAAFGAAVVARLAGRGRLGASVRARNGFLLEPNLGRRFRRRIR